MLNLILWCWWFIITIVDVPQPEIKIMM